MDWIYPKRLEAGMTIAFTVPASATLESLDALQAQVEAWGCKAVFGPSCYRSGEYGGTAAEQAKELNDFLTDSSCDAVVAVRVMFDLQVLRAQAQQLDEVEAVDDCRHFLG